MVFYCAPNIFIGLGSGNSNINPDIKSKNLTARACAISSSLHFESNTWLSHLSISPFRTFCLLSSMAEASRFANATCSVEVRPICNSARTRARSPPSKESPGRLGNGPGCQMLRNQIKVRASKPLFSSLAGRAEMDVVLVSPAVARPSTRFCDRPGVQACA